MQLNYLLDARAFTVKGDGTFVVIRIASRKASPA